MSVAFFCEACEVNPCKCNICVGCGNKFLISESTWKCSHCAKFPTAPIKDLEGHIDFMEKFCNEMLSRIKFIDNEFGENDAIIMAHIFDDYSASLSKRIENHFNDT